MRIFIRLKQEGSLSGNLSTFAIKVKPESQIYEIKGYISNRLGLEPWEQKLTICQTARATPSASSDITDSSGTQRSGTLMGSYYIFEEENCDQRILHNDWNLLHYNIKEDDCIFLERVGGDHQEGGTISHNRLTYNKVVIHIYIYI